MPQPYSKLSHLYYIHGTVAPGVYIFDVSVAFPFRMLQISRITRSGTATVRLLVGTDITGGSTVGAGPTKQTTNLTPPHTAAPLDRVFLEVLSVTACEGLSVEFNVERL